MNAETFWKRQTWMVIIGYMEQLMNRNTITKYLNC